MIMIITLLCSLPRGPEYNETNICCIFPLFLVMVMYANEFKTKEKQKLTATYIIISN